MSQMKWAAHNRRMRNTALPSTFYRAASPPRDPKIAMIAAQANARMQGPRLRRGTVGINEAAEQSTRQRKITVTLPKLKFMEGDNG